MKINSTISFLLIAFFLVYAVAGLASFSEPSSAPTGSNEITAIDTSANLQSSPNILGFTELLSGAYASTSVSLNTVGGVGISKAGPDSDVKISVNGSIRSDLLIGNGISPVCLGSESSLSLFIIRC